MPTKRRRIAPRRLDQKVPAWARRLLEGELPEDGSEEHHAYAGWLFFSDRVPGLPDADSETGKALWLTARGKDRGD